MVLIATGDVKLAQKLGRLIDGPKCYVTKPRNGTDLRHWVHCRQPDVVVLDVRLGGNEWLAMESVSKIVTARSSPAVVVLVPWESAEVDREAARLGCYDVLSLARRDSLKHVGRSVSEAQTAKQAGELPRHVRRAAVTLH